MKPTDQISSHFRLTEIHKSALERLGIKTIHDLLMHVPSRYSNIGKIQSIAELSSGDTAIVYGQVTSTRTRKAFHSKVPIGEVTIRDATGTIKATWFHQPYVAKMMEKGDFVKLEGKITAGKSGHYLTNPEFEKVKSIPADLTGSLFENTAEEAPVHTFYPVYPESKGITSRWFYHTIQKIFRTDVLDALVDPLPEDMLRTYNLPTLKTALVWVHSPKSDADAVAARKRFAFEEIFFIQMKRQLSRVAYEEHPAFIITPEASAIEEFISRFPFTLTNSQQHAIEDVLGDLKRDKPGLRLLEGDVGSGKTAVAAVTTFAAVSTRPVGQNFGNLQTAFMCPTEILAAQHFESFMEYFRTMPINIGLITSSGCKKFPSKMKPDEATTISRAQLLKWVANGEIPILIGTHSLIQSTVEFKNLAYVIIDEQHRFGTKQRAKLVRKDDIAPHLLSMTATPIPRTLALTIYGDLDLTIVDEMPRGRKPIHTEIVIPAKRNHTYELVRKELKSGRQVYVICPRIDEPDPNKAQTLNVKSVKEEAKRLKEQIFPEYEIDILHSKMKSAEKDAVMDEFAQGSTHILVATSVVEVGVNVPNATVIIIEGGERFGLSQLHQLRGRVLRSNHQAYCYVFAETKTKKSLERLDALITAKNGFELSELDLKIRGAGELAGKKQWGISDVGMEAIRNIKMVEAARKEVLRMLKSDPTLKNNPLIRERVERDDQEVHFE